MSKNKLLRIEFPKVRKITKKGNTYYEVDCRRVDWRGQKKYSFTNKSDALEKARTIAEEVKKNGIETVSGLSQQLADKRLNQWTTQLEEHGKTIGDAVEHYIGHLDQKSASESSPLISELCSEWSNYKSTDPKKELRSPTIRGIRSHANLFSRDFATHRIGTITSKDIDTVLNALKKPDSTPVTNQTRRNYINYLRQFFNWCIRHDYTERNPAKKVEVQVLAKPPTFLTLLQCQKLLQLVQSDTNRPLLGYITICLFAGLRPTEAEQLAWEQIEIDHDAIVITPDRTKTKRGRRAEISSNLKSWLRTLDNKQVLIPANFKRRFTSYRKEFSKTVTKWSPDILRHTYATFWLSKFNDRNKLAELMGNSPSIIGKHYLRHANKVDTDKFWSLGPMNEKAEEFFDIK